MGLDMYFYARKSEYASYSEWDAKEGKKDLTNYPEALRKLGEDIMVSNFKSRTAETSYQIGYFRKFNALHGYIVREFAYGKDECQEIRLDKERVEILVEVLRGIVKEGEDKDDLMPPTDGFFFGSETRDDYYYECVTEAFKLFKSFLENINFEEYEIIYRASW